MFWVPSFYSENEELRTNNTPTQGEKIKVFGTIVSGQARGIKRVEEKEEKCKTN